MADIHGSGPYAIAVEWNVKDKSGKNLISVYRYKNEKVRDEKLASFRKNPRVKAVGKTI